MQTRLLLGSLLLGGIACALWAANYYAGIPIPSSVLLLCRWAALAAFCGYAAFRRSLTVWVAVGIFLGAEIGYDFPEAGKNLQILSTIFLRLIKTIIAPLIFSTLVVGIAGHANLKQVGRMAIKAIVYFELVTTIALLIGLAAINISKAGVGVSPPEKTQQIEVKKQTSADLLLHVFPENIAKSVAEGEILQVAIFSILFGFALALISEQKRRPVLEFFEGVSEVMFKFTNIIMLSAPIGVTGAIAYTVSKMGFGVLLNLLKLVATLYGALVVFVLLVFLPIALIAHLPIKRFLKAVAEPASIAFATASSEAALPRAMESMEAFGVPRQVVAFVIPMGYSFNLDGSSLYASLAAIFAAQAAGIHLSFGEQFVMMITLMLTSKGIAGVPRATLVILLATINQFHLPDWPIYVLLGVDQLMDMGRTMINVVGNCLATAVIAIWEGEFRKEAPSPVVMDAVAQ